MVVNNKIPTSCKTNLLTGQQFIDLLPTVELLTDGLIFIGSLSHLILMSQCQNVVLILRLYELVYLKHLMNICEWKKWIIFFFKMKVHNKSFIDWVRGQQQFCLPLDRICCPQPAASGNRSVLWSNKNAVFLEPSQ